MLNKVWRILLIIYMLVLPLQTRWLYGPKFINDKFWEYGSESLFGTEILLWVIIIIFAADHFRRRTISHLFGRFHYETHKKNLFLAIGFILFLALSVLHSVNIAVSYNYVFRILEGVCLLLVIVSSGERSRLMNAFWFSAIAEALLGIFQFFIQEVSANKWLGIALHKPEDLGSFVVQFGDERWLRAYGSFGSPNILGGFLAVAFVLGLVLYLGSRPAAKIYLTLGQSAILTGLVVTFSRGAWAAAILGWISVGAYIIWQGNNKELSFWQRYHPFGLYLKQCVIYAILFAGLFTLLSPIFLVRFNTKYRLEAKSLSDRRAQYAEAAQMFKKDPLLGVGPGAYTYQLHLNEPKKPAYDLQPVHNIFFLVLCEWGVVGFAIWLALFGSLVRAIWRRHPDLLPILLVVLVAGAFDHFWWSLPGGIYLWWVGLGILI